MNNEERQQIVQQINALSDKSSLNRKERRHLYRLKKKLTLKQADKINVYKKLFSKLFIVLVIVLSIAGLFWYASTRPNLPPTDIEGHLEENPPSHIMDKPLPLLVQKHMLEHADGSGPPGVIINYNCQDFNCDAGLIKSLTDIANKYPEFVYLAPYPSMSKKIAITRFGKIQTYDNFNKDALIKFIENRN